MNFREILAIKLVSFTSVTTYHEIIADSLTQINNSIIPENQQSFKTAAWLFFVRCMEPQSAGMAH